VDSSKSVDTDSRIALSRFKSGVSQHLGDIADIGSTFEHQGRDAVTQEVAATALVDARSRETEAHLATEIPGVRATEWDRVMFDLAERFGGVYDGDEIGPF
jgi:hypothetical protein